MSGGAVAGGKDAPRFIFGRLNKNFRAEASEDDVREGLDRMRARMARKLGRKPTPEEMQDAFRRRLIARTRGRMLMKMMAKNGGKPPSPEQFKRAMDKWRANHLEERMGPINEALGTTGAGYNGRGSRGRLMSSRRLERVADRAAEKAALSDDAVRRLKRALEEYLEEQRAEVASRVASRADHLTRKPTDLSVWWDAKKWDERLTEVLRPHAMLLAEMAQERVAEEVEQPTGKADLLGSSVLERLMSTVGRRIKGINATTRDKVQAAIREGLEAGDGAAQLGERIRTSAAFDEYRAELVARTETATVLNAAATESYRELGVQRVQVIDGDEDEVCATANGQTWTLAEADANPIGHPNCTRDFAPILGAA